MWTGKKPKNVPVYKNALSYCLVWGMRALMDGLLNVFKTP